MANTCIRIVTAIMLFIALVFDTSLCAQDAPSQVEFDSIGFPKEVEPAFTQEQADEWLKLLQPQVESFAGRKFAKLPQIRVCSRQDMLEAWERDVRTLVPADAPKEDADMAIMLKALEIMSRGPYMFARYCHSEHAIDAPASQTMPLLTLMKIADAPVDGVMKLVIAHELAHALHLEHMPEWLRDRAQSPDHVKAREATLEGFAMLVQTHVAKQLGLTELNDRLIKASQADDAKSETANSLSTRYRELYVTGLRFFEHHFADGGIDNVWAILADPPQTYAHVTQPERYGEAVKARIDTARLFEGIAVALDAPNAAPRTMTVDGESLQRNFAQLGKDKSDAAVRLVERAHTCIVPAGTSIRSVSCYELREAGSADDMLALMGELVDKQLETSRKKVVERGGTVSVTNDPFTAGQAKGFLRQIDAIENPGSTKRTMIMISAVAHDRFIVQVMLSNDQPLPDMPREASEFVLNRLASGEASMIVPVADETNPLVAALRAIKPVLGEGQWDEKIQPQPKSALEAFIGDDMKAGLALELSYRSSQGVIFEATSDPRESRRLLMVSIAQFNDEKAAEVVGDAYRANLKAAFDRLRSFAPELKPSEVETIAFGELTCSRTQADVQIMGQQAHIAAITARFGKHVIYMLDNNHALDQGKLERVIQALAQSLE